MTASKLPEPASRRWLFRILASALVPAVILVCLELALRTIGFGRPTTFFVPRQIDGQKLMVENASFGLNFFPPGLARGSSPVVMQARKPKDCFRIFLFGESAALGDPRPAYGVGRWLETLLQERFPKVKIEVVCVAITAINSHAILPIARECAGYEGDLWVIYMGNNEMVGPFGASEVFGKAAPSARLVRLYLALQRSRLGQGFVALLQKCRARKTPATWGGMKMFLDQQVPPADPRREQVYRNFQANLTSIIRAGTASGVPVVLCSVASNLKDCPPFASLPPRDLALSKLAEWSALLASGATNQARNEFPQAVQSLEQASRIAPQNPDLQFQLGECYLKTGRTEEAQRSFMLARDLDTLPFRADSRINEIIRTAATRFADSRVSFLDSEKALASSSSVSIPGEESFYEHVHLNFSGNYRLAVACAELVLPHLARHIGMPTQEWANEAICSRRLGLTDWNRQAALEEIKSRLLDPPFSTQRNHDQRLGRLDAAIWALEMQTRDSSAQDVRRVYEEALEKRPGDHWLHHNYAEYLTRIGDLAQATTQMQTVCKLVPQHYSGFYHTGRLLARQKKYEEARQVLEIALNMRPEFPDIYLELGRASTAQGNKEAALRYCRLAEQRGADDGRVHVLEAKILENLKRRGEAVNSLRAAIRLDPGLWEAHDMLGAELALGGNFGAAQLEFEETVRLRPNYAEGHLNLGIALARQRQFPAATAQFQETLRLEPRNQRAREFLAALEQLQEQ